MLVSTLMLAGQSKWHGERACSSLSTIRILASDAYTDKPFVTQSAQLTEPRLRLGFATWVT